MATPRGPQGHGAHASLPAVPDHRGGTRPPGQRGVGVQPHPVPWFTSRLCGPFMLRRRRPVGDWRAALGSRASRGPDNRRSVQANTRARWSLLVRRTRDAAVLNRCRGGAGAACERARPFRTGISRLRPWHAKSGSPRERVARAVGCRPRPATGSGTRSRRGRTRPTGGPTGRPPARGHQRPGPWRGALLDHHGDVVAAGEFVGIPSGPGGRGPHHRQAAVGGIQPDGKAAQRLGLKVRGGGREVLARVREVGLAP